jgi:hypothetical protein
MRWLMRYDGSSDQRNWCTSGSNPTLRLQSAAQLRGRVRISKEDEAEAQAEPTQPTITSRFSRAPPHDTTVALVLGSIDHPQLLLDLRSGDQQS